MCAAAPGGHVLVEYTSDTWIWDGAEWTRLLIVNPPPRASAVMATLNGKAVLFGATGQSDTWTFDGTAWTQLQIQGPEDRNGAFMAPLGGKLILYGGERLDDGPGYSYGDPIGDTWSFDGTAWTQLMIAGPPARGFGVMGAAGDELVLFGGQACSGDPDFCYLQGDTWTFDGSAWTEASSISQSPGARAGGASASLGDSFVMNGGSSGDDSVTCTVFADTWAWNGTMWRRLARSGLPALDGSVMSKFQGELVLSGGDSFSAPGCVSQPFINTATWNGHTWSQLNVPSPEAASAVMAAL